jgi:hypothetical protein
MKNKKTANTTPKKPRRNWSRIIFLALGVVLAIVFLMEPVLMALSR